MDIKGSSSITDLADNVCSVWRNKAKDDGSVDAGAADAVLYLDKQRNGEWEGAISLWFDKQSMQYREDALSHVKRHTIESKFVEEVTL
jgi:twinkle protein